MKLFITLLISFVLASGLSAGDSSLSTIDPASLVFSQVTAVRTSAAPSIDGDLSDPVWLDAVPITAFLQMDPVDLGKPTEQTEVRILYDDDNFYVSFISLDENPDRIVSRLARRDTWIRTGTSSGGGGMRRSSESIAVNSSDWVGLALDTRDDNRTAYNFIVNAAGSKVDAYIYDDERYDRSWDGVWDVQVKTSDEGWVAEFRLPFSMFNFPHAENLTWGVSLKRFIFRKQERLEWPGKKRGVQGNVSRFGILNGLSNVPPPRQIELIPYGLGGYHADGDDKLTRNAGVDIEYGLASNTTLNLTINPDFGQVEADPSVLNLTAFETFYDDKRPFFVEGASFFENPSPSFKGRLFHSRRVGKRPGYFSPEEGSIVTRPQATTILGAAKLLGKTASGLEFGVVEAVTDEEYGTVEYMPDDTTVVRERFLLEPYTNHFIGRLRKQIVNDLSTIGMVLTDQRRKGGHTASTGALDWRLKFLDNRVSFIGQMMMSQVGVTRGTAGRLHLAYDDPVWWNLKLRGAWYDDDFNVNDLGFLKRTGLRLLETDLSLRRQDPWGPLLRGSLRLGYDFAARTDGTVLDREVDVSLNATTLSYWSLGLWTKYVLPAFDDDDTFKDSRAWVIRELPRRGAFIWLRTDNRKWISLNPSVGFGRGESGSWGYRFSLGMTVRPTPNLSATVRSVINIKETNDEWIGVEEADDGEKIIYANSSQQTQDVTLRLNWTFSPDLSFQVYFQPFKADVDYFGYKSLSAPKTLDFEPYDYAHDPDFRLNNTVGTFVWRWEYLPGSTLFVVYNLNDSNTFSASEGSWDPSKSNTLFIKLNYWFQV